GSLAGRRAIALDTESDSLHHHREKVCLVQIGVEEGGWVVDPLAARDLSPLAPLLADRGVVKVFHGADYDVTTLKRDFAFTFASVFDTMIASRVLGRPEIGLQALLRTEFGIALVKDSQKDDWSRRPLTETQEAYALADVNGCARSAPRWPRSSPHGADATRTPGRGSRAPVDCPGGSRASFRPCSRGARPWPTARTCPPSRSSRPRRCWTWPSVIPRPSRSCGP
ncbi:MAG: hypothetical protein DMF77_23350, partial [Acidobacteria bacterium]